MRGQVLALLVLLACGSCRKHVAVDPLLVPIAQGYDANTLTQNRTGFLSPFLCISNPSRIACQATMDVTLRRGSSESKLVRGSTFWWDWNSGMGDGVIWWGCPSTAECEAAPHMATDAMVVTPGQGAFAVRGDPLRVPPGNIGIAAVAANANGFLAVYDRWAGAWAPPLLLAGPGVEIHCTAAQCRVMVTTPPAAPAAKTSLTISGSQAVTAQAGTAITCAPDGKCTVSEAVK